VDAETQFWWNWWVNVAVALATLLAVLVALFRDWIKNKLFKPDLRLELSEPRGELVQSMLPPDGRVVNMRLYHLRVRNGKTWPPATEVQVFLLQIEEPGPGGELQILWRGDIPFPWRHQTLYPLARTIGHDAGVAPFQWTV
jgi:hypothetical protein